MISRSSVSSRNREIGASFLRKLIIGQTIGIVAILIMVSLGGITDQRLFMLIPLGIFGVIIGFLSYLFLHRGYIVPSGYIFFLGTSLLITVTVFVRGYQDASTFLYLWPILTAMSILDTRGGAIILSTSILSYLIVALIQYLGYFYPPIPFDAQKGGLWIVGSAVVIFCLLSYSVWISGQNASRALIESQGTANKLRELNETLEERVSERTFLLEQRNSLLQTLSDFTRLGSQAHNENELLEKEIQLLTERINVDHLNVFILDENEESAMLRAAKSDEGKSLIAQSYQIKVSRGISPKIFPESNFLHYQIGTRSYLISTPVQLKNAKTNLSFPIATNQRLYGILNVQTISPLKEVTAPEFMQMFADRLALSIENIRLFDQLQERQKEISILAGQTVKSSWENARGSGSRGFTYDRIQTLPIDVDLGEEASEQLRSRHSVAYITSSDKPQARLVAPIILRDDVIGMIGIEDEVNHEWLAEEKALLETISSRVSLALENTRLVAEAQQRADRERIIGHVSSRMRESLDIDTMLQMAVQEIRQSLKLKEVEIRLQLATPITKETK